MSIRVGVIGVGHIGSAHARAIFEGKADTLTLVAVCDVSKKRRDWARENLPGVEIYDTSDELFAKAQLDAVIIATPHYFHPPIAIAAFEQGLHVLTEKPAGVSVTQVQLMTDAAKKSGKRFGIMWNQRTAPLYRRVREIVKSGALGDRRRLIWDATAWYRTQEYYDSGAWRATWNGEGGGVLMNQAPHQLDLLQWIFGMPEYVTATCREGKYHNIEVEDEATLMFRYDNGDLALFTTSTGRNPGINRLEISGSLGKIIAAPGELEFIPAAGNYAPAFKETFNNPEAEHVEGHIGILRDFAHAIETGAPLLAEGSEGINELELCNAAYLSSWKNEPIYLPVDGEEFDRLLANKRAHSRKKAESDGGGDGEYKKKWSENS